MGKTARVVPWIGIPLDMASALEGVCFRLSSQKLSADFAPFGQQYHNLKGDLYLSEYGGIANECCMSHPAPSGSPGSIFPLDAAFLIACAWGQRFHHIVTIPVGFEERVVIHPTLPGESYRCTVFPVSEIEGLLQFDIWIHDTVGNLCEYFKGVKMRNISAGRIYPPDWIRGEKKDSLANIRKHSKACSVIDHDTLAVFSARSLSKGESERFMGMAKTRQQNYLSARIALKYLFRRLSGGDVMTPAPCIHTVMPDGIRPCCPISGNKDAIYCSVSHDRRFAIAVAGDKPLGVDVEIVSDRIMKVRHTYMTQEELKATDASPLGSMQAAIRIWSIKECVSKATDMTLPQSWKQVLVEEIGPHESRLSVAGEKYRAFHDNVDDHIFTFVQRGS